MSGRLLFLVSAAIVTGIVVFFFAPLLGAVIVIGSVGALGVVVFPAVVGRVAGWLSGAPMRRR